MIKKFGQAVAILSRTILAAAAVVGASTLCPSEAHASLATFSDDFSSGDWSFYKSGGVGNGYLSYRPAVARSPNYIGDLYNNRDSSATWQSLSKIFILETAYQISNCAAYVYIKPQTAVTGALELIDPFTDNYMGYKYFSLGATNTWTKIQTPTSFVGTASNWVRVRVTMYGNSQWQEFLIDDLYGTCGLTN